MLPGKPLCRAVPAAFGRDEPGTAQGLMFRAVLYFKSWARKAEPHLGRARLF